MNTFEQLIGRRIAKVLQVKIRDDYPRMGECLAIFLMLDENSGLVISFESYHKTTTLDYMTLEKLMDEYGTEWGEACLIEIESSNRLNCIVGQRLESIQIAQPNEELIVGNNFIIKRGNYAGVFIRTARDKLALYATIDGGQILFDVEEFPGTQQGWTLQ